MTQKVMSLFLLNFQDDLGQGFTVNLTIWPDDSPNRNMIAGGNGRLPPAPEDLIRLYKAWKDAYKKYLNSYHYYLKVAGPPSTHNDPATFVLKGHDVITNLNIEQAENQKQIDYNACVSCEDQLIERFNQWLKSLESKDLKSPESLSIVEKLRHHLGQSKDAGHRILVQSNDPDLRKMPWTKWSLLKDFSRTEIGLSQHNFEQRDIKVNRQINQVRILTILGKDANIKGEIEKLAKNNNIDIRIVTNLAELDEPLWREPWDIIIFNGHSNSEHGTTGEFSLSETEKLTISNLRGHFNQAIERGLKLVIFNSCDGLGLAHQLGEGEKLYLSQVIVMRELLPAPVAPIFLGYLFEEFTQGVSLYEAMRLTKERLRPLEKTQYPGISALPVICQNPTESSLFWGDFTPAKPTAIIPENLPNLTKIKFVGRENDLINLQEKLQTTDQPLAITAVAGMSGMGKTELANQYAHQHFNDYPGGICWLLGQMGKGKISLLTELSFFVQNKFNLILPDDLGGEEKIVAYCWEHWSGEGNVLVILDDVKNYQEVEPFLPRNKRFKILLTTQIDFSSNADVETYHLERLSREKSLELLESFVGEERLEKNRDIFTQLCEFLGDLPLGLVLAGQYLKELPKLPVVKYWENIQGKKITHDSLNPGNNVSRSEQTRRGIRAAFQLTWERIGEIEGVQELAVYFSLYALAPIPCEINWEEENAEELERALQTLRQWHILEERSENIYEIHALMRHFLQEKLTELDRGQELKRQFVGLMLNVAEKIDYALTNEIIAQVSPYIEHITEVARNYPDDLLGDFRESLITPYVRLGNFYQGQSFYEPAEFWLKQGLSLAAANFPDDHTDIATCCSYLAGLYESQGRYEDAKPLYLRA
ncbi:NB-ARC domain-containing protein, partial [Planktothricoides sp. SR001]|uniref:NB-ARC domain-containing protein n=1 Tax=Planktothricoides sp. SR001 TaxID=1705388 RepID=UPI001E64015B